jgi:hypothetical protein
MAPARLASYRGPGCPFCATPFAIEAVVDGPLVCPRCSRQFEARVLHPPARVASVLQLAQSGPEGAGACANHPRNAAVTSCGRCGIFICALCELPVDGAHYCPACFDRLAQEGAIDSARLRFRDYGSLASFVAVVGLFFSVFLGLPLGVLTFYYVYKGAKARRETGVSAMGLVLSAIVGVMDIFIGALFIYSFFLARKH